MPRDRKRLGGPRWRRGVRLVPAPRLRAVFGRRGGWWIDPHRHHPTCDPWRDAGPARSGGDHGPRGSLSLRQPDGVRQAEVPGPLRISVVQWKRWVWRRRGVYSDQLGSRCLHAGSGARKGLLRERLLCGWLDVSDHRSHRHHGHMLCDVHFRRLRLRLGWDLLGDAGKHLPVLLL